MSDIKLQIEANLITVQSTIQKQAKHFERDLEGINLIAVSKKQPLENVQAILDCGHRLFGENRVQEAVQRWSPLRDKYPDLKLHLIGPLQTNKVKDAVALFNVIETVDRPKLVEALILEMKKQNKKISCFIQVNTGSELQKSGVLPQDLNGLLNFCKERGLNVSGLMCIPPTNEPSALHFAFLQKLAKENNLKNLSMGMSSDFEKAIPLGATYLRVGTNLFGQRNA